RLIDATPRGARRTDDRGMFRLYGVLPGEYLVSADRSGSDVTYFPGTSNPVDAQRVRIEFGGEVSNVDVPLASMPTVRVAGTILDSTGKPIQSGLILARSRRSGGLVTNPMAARQFPDGRFEFTSVAPGEYVLQAFKRDSTNEPNLYDEGESVSQLLVVAGADVTGINLRTTRGGTISGKISFEGEAESDLFSTISLSAVPVDFDRTPQNLGYSASAAIQP